MRGSYISMGGSQKENFSIFEEKLSLTIIPRKFLESFSRKFLRKFLFTILAVISKKFCYEPKNKKI